MARNNPNIVKYRLHATDVDKIVGEPKAFDEKMDCSNCMFSALPEYHYPCNTCGVLSGMRDAPSYYVPVEENRIVFLYDQAYMLTKKDVQEIKRVVNCLLRADTRATIIDAVGMLEFYADYLLQKESL